MRMTWYEYDGQQVVTHTLVVGATPLQRIMQRVSDILEGWAKRVDQILRTLP